MINRRTVLTGVAVVPFAGVAGAVEPASDAEPGLYLLPPDHWMISVSDTGVVIVGAMVRKFKGSNIGSVHWMAFRPDHQISSSNIIDHRFADLKEHDKDVKGVVVYDEYGINYVPYKA